jgi:tol-pal system protein YbgF
MATRVMVIWILLLQFMWGSVYVYFDHHYTLPNGNDHRVAQLEHELHARDRDFAKFQMRLAEYKDAVAASGLIIKDQTPWTDSKREIASVMADIPGKDLSFALDDKSDFEKAKKIFLSEDYQRSAELFSDFTDKHPDSRFLVQAYYFLTESEYHNDDFERATKAIDTLVTQFPETEYTGYSLVRMGMILEKQDRVEDAADIYERVKTGFPHSNAAHIADENLKGLSF